MERKTFHRTFKSRWWYDMKIGLQQRHIITINKFSNDFIHFYGASTLCFSIYKFEQIVRLWSAIETHTHTKREQVFCVRWVNISGDWLQAIQSIQWLSIECTNSFYSCISIVRQPVFLCIDIFRFHRVADIACYYYLYINGGGEY